MKKYTFAILSLCALTLGACSNQNNTNTSQETKIVSTTSQSNII